MTISKSCNMSRDEFLLKAIGTPYVRPGYTFEGCDCFGLVYLYYKHVLGHDLFLTDIYKSDADITVAFSQQFQSGNWEKVDEPRGGDVAFMLYVGGSPFHCGIMIDDNNVLHSIVAGGSGQVQIMKMSVLMKVIDKYCTINKIYDSRRIEYYRCTS